VYYRRFNRKPWPEMISAFNRVVSDYQALACHDATGIGNVVHDLVDERVIKFVMSGPKRTQMLTNYVTAVEQGKYQLPRNTPAYNQHKSTTVEEVYGGGGWNSHLSDDVAAFALAHHAAERASFVAGTEGIKKTEYAPAKFKEITAVHVEDDRYVSQTGDVTTKDSYEGVAVFWT
jgi:hypothetical protein